MTIFELMEHCQTEIRKGNGDKEVIICIDDYNFLLLNYGFSHPSGNSENIDDCLDDEGLNRDEVIVLN